MQLNTTDRTSHHNLVYFPGAFSNMQNFGPDAKVSKVTKHDSEKITK